jgi:hypothetical protein
MRNQSNTLDMIIGAMLKLDHKNGERQNVLAFVHSCYCGKVRLYDLERALESLTKLTDEEQNALITWVVISDDVVRKAARRRAA